MDENRIFPNKTGIIDFSKPISLLVHIISKKHFPEI